ncbi:ankyrin repeat domain-containing protein [Kitasatospora sp. NPDC057518]|uniref:ankyrin repeat domain-containing protein n=1 Tax=Kitasatospora sp. NPDC057518 TaxID=3346155 RepID=UPI0036B89C43
MTADGRLVAAVRARDVDGVWEALAAGADPSACDADGLPLLWVAVNGLDHEVAGVLVDHGADPDRPLPDGTTPLLRAVDLGSSALVGAVLGKDPALRMPADAREHLLALARAWHETGTEEELRRRTGAVGPAERVWATEQYADVEQVSLGGLTVRAGHGAVLTGLEWRFRVLTPVDELVARAVRHREPGHVGQQAVRFVLGERRSRETWSALTAHHRHPDPAHRRFVAAFLCDTPLLRMGHAVEYEAEETELLVAWASAEPDGGVLAEVLRALGGRECPEEEAVGLRHAAASVLAPSADRTPEVADALAALLDVDDRPVRLEAACGLALRDDPRTAEAVDRLGPLTGPEYECDDRAGAIRAGEARNPPEGT